MKRSEATFGIFGVFLFAVVAVSAQTPPVATPPASLVARGEYLTTRVAMCVQCHSPRDEKGVIIEALRFTGAPIPFQSPYANGHWAAAAPNIRSLRGFTDEQALMLLTEGHAGERPAPQLPMPPFRMSQDDARAVIAFLRAQ
ncbi:MAG: c-type cytochrome [Vicinamibacteria bacterium]